MIILDRTLVASTPVSRGIFMRELAARQDRPSVDQQIDLPEIQESSRVSFSDAVHVSRFETLRDSLQTATPTDEGGAAERRLQIYREIAAL